MRAKSQTRIKNSNKNEFEKCANKKCSKKDAQKLEDKVYSERKINKNKFKEMKSVDNDIEDLFSNKRILSEGKKPNNILKYLNYDLDGISGISDFKNF